MNSYGSSTCINISRSLFFLVGLIFLFFNLKNFYVIFLVGLIFKKNVCHVKGMLAIYFIV